MKQEKPCIREVNENLRLVEEGKPLNKSLRYLNQSCQFKKRFDILMDIKFGKTEEVKAKIKEYEKEYYQRPEVKARLKAKYREYQKEYYQKKKQEEQK